ETAREVRPHQRMAAPDDADQQFIHKTVLGTPQNRQVETRRRQKGTGIDAAAVGRVESHRSAPFGRLEDFKRGIKFVGMYSHGLIEGLVPKCRVAEMP